MDDAKSTALVIIVLLGPSLVGILYGRGKNRAGEGFILGLMLNLLGLLILACLPAKPQGSPSFSVGGMVVIAAIIGVTFWCFYRPKQLRDYDAIWTSGTPENLAAQQARASTPMPTTPLPASPGPGVISKERAEAAQIARKYGSP